LASAAGLLGEFGEPCVAATGGGAVAEDSFNAAELFPSSTMTTVATAVTAIALAAANQIQMGGFFELILTDAWERGFCIERHVPFPPRPNLAAWRISYGIRTLQSINQDAVALM
jgi:hypothetical protein